MTLRKSWLIGSPVDGGGLPTEATATAQDGRVGHAGLFAQDAFGVVRAGVLGNQGALVSDRSDMAVDIDPFAAVLTRGAADGVVPVANDGLATVTLPAAPSSNSRWVRVYVLHHDDVDGADADNEPIFGVVSGAAAASPTLPAVPTGALPIVRVLQPANVLGTASCTVTEDFPMTAAAGGVVVARDSAELTAWAPNDGALAIRLDNDLVYKRVDGAWVAISSEILSGAAGIAAGAGYVLGADITVVRLAAKVVTLQFHATRSGANMAGGELMASLPAGLRPAKQVRWAGELEGLAWGGCAGVIATDGQIIFRWGNTPSNAAGFTTTYVIP